MTFIRCENSGAVLTGSNFWESELNRAGYYYLTPNAGALRLLVPTAREKDLHEIKTARECLLTRGLHRTHHRELYELLFDDHTENPFALFLSPEQLERPLTLSDFQSGPRPFVIYTCGPHRAFEIPCYFRAAPLPCLKPLDSLSA